ncbi:WD40 repeat-containing protein [Xenococcus sp. PCC 7305]|uniref:NACHT and WD repeat domain-containing protein n=1 Tax=Xenococcus sp. PCC 7305 TaxID=102125 RepID=UPI0002AC04D9|nr:AAA family ATPase [Xenococcus sp. PCC 7305]ELS03557.1 WD40 repeat-containing protein [Xenococcus sp. PCC 7305]
MSKNQDKDSPAESRENNITNINLYGGNYNEKIEGNYYQNREVILQRNFVARSPYKGLKRFNAKDKELFFGRSRLTSKIIQAVNQSNLVLVLGASGSGKSSVVRAGVIPQMEDLSTSQTCLFTPNRNPFVSFHRSLLDPEADVFDESEVEFVLEGGSNTLGKTFKLLKSKDAQWLIFIDQFEELFTSCSNIETRRNFIQGIVELVQDKKQSVKLVLAMRSDFLEELGAYPKFSEIAEKNISLVADLQTEELRQAIAEPAAKHGVVFESGLVEEIIKDVQGQAGSLPLLQYTLNLLWQESDLSERVLKSETYRQLGGVSGALQKHVNQIYQEFSPEQQLATKQILLRLVDVVISEKSEDLRTAVSRRAYKSEFTDIQAETVQLLVDQSLLVSDELRQEKQATVEIAHEALLTSWAELKDWISDARSTISLNNRLAEDAARWQGLRGENQERANEELWTGSKLEKAIELRKDGTFDIVLGGLGELVNGFIDASVEWREQRIQKELEAAKKIAVADRKIRIEAQKRAKEQKEANIKLRIWSIVAGSFGIAASFLGIISYFVSQESQLKQRAAEIKVQLSVKNGIEYLLESIDLVGDNQKFNQRSFNTINKLLLEVQSVLYQAVEDSREKSAFNDHNNSVWSVAFSPDGQHIVTCSADKMIKLWSLEEQSLVHNFNGHKDYACYVVRFSADGKYIVSAGGDKTIKLWSVEEKSLVHNFNGHKDKIVSVNFSPDGKYLISAS